MTPPRHGEAGVDPVSVEPARGAPAAPDAAPESVTGPERRGPVRWLAAAHGAKLLVAAEVVVILLAWQWVSGVARLVNPIYLPPPTDLAAAAVTLVDSGELLTHLAPSAKAWTTGLALALVVAIPLGMLLGRSYAAHRLASPFIWSLYAIPWLAYQPLSKVWFGFGMAPVVFLVFIAALFPTLLNTAAGVGTAKASLLNAARVFGADRLAILRKVVLPSSLPLMLAGIRQSVATATIALIVAEMNGPSAGIGTLIVTKSQARATDEAFAGILVAVLWTLTMTYVVKFAGQKLAPWQRDARA